MRILFAAAFALGLAQPANAQEMTGSEFHSLCEQDASAVKEICGFYVLGVVSGLYYGASHGIAYATETQATADMVKRSVDVCMPKGTKMHQIRLVIQKYMEERPEEHHLPAFRLIKEGMSDAFPCEG